MLAVFSIALVAALTFTLRIYIDRLQSTQHSLRDSEAKFFGLFRQSPVPHTLVRNLDGQFVEANDAWLQQYGYQLQDVIGRSARDLNIWVNRHSVSIWWLHWYPMARSTGLRWNTATATGTLLSA